MKCSKTDSVCVVFARSQDLLDILHCTMHLGQGTERWLSFFLSMVGTVSEVSPSLIVKLQHHCPHYGFALSIVNLC